MQASRDVAGQVADSDCEVGFAKSSVRSRGSARNGLGALVMAASTACSVSAPAEGTAFLCRVEGRVKAPLTANALCSAMRAALRSKLPGGLAPVDALGAEARDWVRVDVRTGKGGVLSGRITRARAGTVESLPEVSIAQSDRPPGLDTAERLAGELAAQIR